jgi:hypothetical protein
MRMPIKHELRRLEGVLGGAANLARMFDNSGAHMKEDVRRELLASHGNVAAAVCNGFSQALSRFDGLIGRSTQERNHACELVRVDDSPRLTWGRMFGRRGLDDDRLVTEVNFGCGPCGP